MTEQLNRRAEDKNVQIVQVTNRSLASSEAFCREFAPEAQAVERWEEVASSRDVDVVWIGTHPYMHSEMTCYALQHGKHVFTQARMAASLPEANQMWEAAIRYPELVTGICPAPQGMKGGELVKQLIAEGAIGTPHQALLHSFNDTWLDPNSPAHWRQQSDLSGIQILTLGIYTEVLQRWLGHIVEVEARGNTAPRSLGGRAKKDRAPQSPVISARFLATDHFFIFNSASSASSRVGKLSAHTSLTGIRRAVNPAIKPD